MRLVKLKDCCTIKPPKAEAKKHLSGDDLVSFVPMNNLGIDTPHLILEEDRQLSDVSGSYTYFAENDVLLAKITPCFENGKLGIARGLTNGIGFGSSEFIVFRTNEDLLPEYLYYFLLRPIFREQGKAVMTGAVGHKRVPKDFIENIKIPLPALDVQHQIVSLLEHALSDIENASSLALKNISNSDELLQSYLNDIFEFKGQGWTNSTIGEIGKVSMCKRILKKQTSPEGDIPFYKIGTFGKTPDAFIASQLYEEFKSKFSFPKTGDILLSASGTIGRRVTYDGKPAYFQDSNIVWIDNDESKVLNEYLYHFYSVCNWNPSKGATISRLYNDDLRKIKIAFPDKQEQKNIVQNLVALAEELDDVISIYKRKIALLSELKASILQEAFYGELIRSKGAAA